MARDKTQQNLKYLIYASKPFGFDQSVLNGILVTAKTNNQRFQITGALICRSDLYLQFLEGPASAIDCVYQNIRRDDRHVEVTLLAEGGAQARLFPDWAMRDDPVRNEQLMVRIPAQRWGKPDDLQGAVVWLSSAASDYVHGSVVAVDGGWLGR